MKKYFLILLIPNIKESYRRTIQIIKRINKEEYGIIFSIYLSMITSLIKFLS